jgi:hypothetical protein
MPGTLGFHRHGSNKPQVSRNLKLEEQETEGIIKRTYPEMVKVKGKVVPVLN